MKKVIISSSMPVVMLLYIYIIMVFLWIYSILVGINVTAFLVIFFFAVSIVLPFVRFVMRRLVVDDLEIIVLPKEKHISWIDVRDVVIGEDPTGDGLLPLSFVIITWPFRRRYCDLYVVLDEETIKIECVCVKKAETAVKWFHHIRTDDHIAS